MATATLTPDGERIAVYTEYREKELIKAIPGSRWNGDVEPKRWELPLSWTSCITMRGVFGDKLQIQEPLHNWAWHERQTRVEPALALRELTELPEGEGDSRLYPFQRVGVKWLVTAGSAFLADD